MYMCQKEKCMKNECFDAPWEGHECTMTVMGKFIGIKPGKLIW